MNIFIYVSLCMAVPEDPPQNVFLLNMTSRSISVSWSSPKTITGKYTYVLYLDGPTGYSILTLKHTSMHA